MEVLGKRWTGLILNVLMDGPLRFSALSARLEVVSDRLVSERLKELEGEGIVQRRVSEGRPVRVDYALTKKGRALRQVVGSIEKWASDWVDVPA